MRTIVTLLAFLLVVTVSAADFTGTYKGELNMTGGPVENKLVLKMNGTTLTGTLTNQFGELPIQNGSADGDDLFFFVIVKDEEENFKMVYRGHIFEDEVQFKIEAGERQIDLVMKKTSVLGTGASCFSKPNVPSHS